MTPTAHISVAYPIGSKLTTSGATNSGVPNKIWSFFIGSNFRANPKSIILILFPVLVRQRTFSGWNNENTVNICQCATHHLEERRTLAEGQQRERETVENVTQNVEEEIDTITIINTVLVPSGPDVWFVGCECSWCPPESVWWRHNRLFQLEQTRPRLLCQTVPLHRYWK